MNHKLVNIDGRSCKVTGAKQGQYLDSQDPSKKFRLIHLLPKGELEAGSFRKDENSKHIVWINCRNKDGSFSTVEIRKPDDDGWKKEEAEWIARKYLNQMREG